MNKSSLQPDSPVRLLVVDDEQHIRSALCRALGLMKYVVDGAGSGAEALRLLQCNHYDLMVVDMHMPGMGGLELIARCQQMAPDLLVIVLTGHGTLESAIEAVRSRRVVDYLLKPATVHDVSAAIEQALEEHHKQLKQERLLETIRKAVDEFHKEQHAGADNVAHPSSDRILRAGPLVLDPHARQLWHVSKETPSVDLTEGEAMMLEALMREAGRILPVSTLASALWGREASEHEAESSVRSTIFRLRSKLRETDVFSPELIETVRGRGYRLAPEE